LPVEKRFETGIGDKRCRCYDLIARAPRHRDAREHRIRRADTWKQTRPCRIEILSVVEATVSVGNALRRICAHPKRTGLMMRCAETVVSGAAGSVRLNQLYRLAIGENVHHVGHRGVHRGPKIVVSLRRCQCYQGALDTVLVRGWIEIDPTRMRRQVVEVCRCYFTNTADCNCYVSVRRTAQLLIKVNVRHLHEQLIFGTHDIAAAAGTNLQVKMAK